MLDFYLFLFSLASPSIWREEGIFDKCKIAQGFVNLLNFSNQWVALGNFHADEDPNQRNASGLGIRKKKRVHVCENSGKMLGKFLAAQIARGNYFPSDYGLSRRKKNAASGETLESGTAGQGTSEGKRALYHCNYCNKDITGKIHIKCAMCPDFDLCTECFSVGAEVTPYKSNHPYRVMDNLSFPLICPD